MQVQLGSKVVSCGAAAYAVYTVAAVDMRYLQGGNSTVSPADCGTSLPCRTFLRPPKRPPEAA